MINSSGPTVCYKATDTFELKAKLPWAFPGEYILSSEGRLLRKTLENHHNYPLLTHPLYLVQ